MMSELAGLAERNRLLSVPFAQLDYNAIMDFLHRTSGWIPSGLEVGWRAIHKARTAMTNLPMVERSLSKRWLISRGSESWDDGDVPDAPLAATSKPGP